MFRKENIGISYDSTSSILNNNNYNGRIQIFEEDDPNAKFKMQEKISIKNKATEYRDALNGLQEDSQLSKLYFSEKNISIIQTKLRVGVFNMSNGQYVIPLQNIDNLKIIMRSIYLQYSKHSQIDTIKSQIETLNKYVLDYAIPSVYNEAVAYNNYCRDQSTLVMPFERPKQIDKDFKHLELKNTYI